MPEFPSKADQLYARQPVWFFMLVGWLLAGPLNPSFLYFAIPSIFDATEALLDADDWQVVFATLVRAALRESLIAPFISLSLPSAIGVTAQIL